MEWKAISYCGEGFSENNPRRMLGGVLGWSIFLRSEVLFLMVQKLHFSNVMIVMEESKGRDGVTY